MKNKNKHMLAMLLAICMIPGLSSCGKPADEQLELKVLCAPGPGSENVLENYQPAIDSFCEKNPNVNLILDSLEFTDWETYTDKLQVEIMSGKGPDVLLFRAQDFLDVEKIMAANAFENLSPFLNSDKEFKSENYFEDVMAAGQYEGKQYILPLGFIPDYQLTTSSALKASGVMLEKCKSFDGYIAELATFLERSDGSMKVSDNRGDMDRYSFVQRFDELTELDNTEAGVKSVLFRDTVKAFQPIYQTFPKAPNYSNIREDAVNYLTRGKMIFFSPSNSLGAAGAVAVYEPPILVPGYTMQGRVRAEVRNCAAMTANSREKETAYAFLRELMLPEMQNSHGISWPVLRSAAEQFLEECKIEVEAIANGDSSLSGGVELAPLPQEFCDSFMDMLNKPISAEIRYGAESVARQALEPYFIGEKSLEICLEEVYEQLEIYMSE